MIRIAAILSLAFLLSCETAPPPVVAGQMGPDLAGRAEAECTERGGRWGQGGLAGGFVCYETTRDANQICTSGDQCEGVCLARSGTCSPVKPLFGCNEILTALGGRATLCVD